jgi:hypothetical protein
MDDRFRGKGLWIGLGMLALVFLCLTVAGVATMAAVAPRLGPVYGAVPQVQAPPASESGAVPAPVYGYGPAWYAGWGPFGFISFGIGLFFKLLVFGLVLLLFFRLVRRFLWGPRCWGTRSWGPYWGPRPPKGQEGESVPDDAAGPWAWHRHHRHWGPPPWWGEEPDKAGGTGKPDAADAAYTGPQE